MNPVGQIKKLPLDSTHRNSGAKMGVFGEWEVPLYYSSILEEHIAVRKAAGLFDISHMGEIFVEGGRAEDFLNYALPRNISKMPQGKALYSFLLNPDLGIIDDIIVYRLEADKFLLIVNAGNIEKDEHWLRDLQSHQKAFENDVKISNITEKMGLLALQGPQSQSIAQEALGLSLSDLKYYCFKTWDGGFIARTGYTGEDGFEIMVEQSFLLKLWNSLFQAGASKGLKPCGFGARDTLRLEAGMPLHGHDIDETFNPLEARLAWAIDFSQNSFFNISKLKELKEKGYNRRLIGFQVTERGIPRPHCAIENKNQEVIGSVTSGSFCPYLQKNIGLGYVPNAYAESGALISIRIREKSVAAQVVPLPFYKRHI